MRSKEQCDGGVPVTVGASGDSSVLKCGLTRWQAGGPSRTQFRQKSSLVRCPGRARKQPGQRAPPVVESNLWDLGEWRRARALQIVCVFVFILKTLMLVVLAN